jgi:hypothetical protein
MTYVVFHKDKTIHKTGNIKAFPLWKDEQSESDLVFLELTEENKEYFKDYRKYSKDEILAARAAKAPLKEKHEDAFISCPAPFAMKQLPTGEKLFKRVHGLGSITLNAGEVGDLEFEVPYTHCKLRGIEIMDQSDTCSAELFIEDSTAGNYSGVSRYELNQFGFSVEVSKDFYEKKSNYDSDLYEDMWVVLQITNSSNITQTFRANVELDEVRL